MELTLRNIKIMLQMDQLSCKNPQNLEREIQNRCYQNSMFVEATTALRLGS